MKCCLLLASWFFFPIGMLLFMFLFVCYAAVLFFFFFIKERCNYLSSLMPIFRRLCVVVQSHTLWWFFFLSFILDSSIFFLVCKSTGAFSEEEGEAGWVLRLRLLLVAELGPAYRTCYTQHLLHCLCQNMALRRPGRQCYLSVLSNILQEGKYFLKI